MEPTPPFFESPDDDSVWPERTSSASFGEGTDAGPERGAHEILAALETGLSNSIEGLTILDRELAFEGVGRVDFAGIDGRGRLVLVALLDDSPETASIEALDLAVIAKRHGGLIMHHLGLPPLPSASSPLCVLVAESLDARLLDRLALLPQEFEVFTLQSLVSERGRQTYLVPAVVHGSCSSAPEEEAVEILSPEEFIVSLDTPSREAAEVLVARMERMDSEFDVIFTPSGGRWAFGGREFLRVERRNERIIGRVLPGGRPVVLDGTPAVEGLIEEAFSAYVRLLGLFDENEEAYQVPSVSSEPLLSAEEIAAFQE